MSLAVILAVTTLIVAALFVLGVPVVLCLGTWVTLVAILADDAALLANIGQTAFFGISSFALLAMPLFILTGDLLVEGGVANRLAAFSRSVFGRVSGGTGVATVGAGGIFAAVSGSNAATAAMLGKVMHSEMRDEGYKPGFAAATCAAGGTVGIIIPPSLMFIVYGALLSLPVGALFLAGVIPGLLMVAAMGLTVYVVARRSSVAGLAPRSGRALMWNAWQCKHVFLTIVLVLGGIYLGAFSPTEAAAVAVVYLAVSALLERTLRVHQLPTALSNSAATTGVLAPLIAFSIVVQQVFSIVGLPDWIRGAFLSLGGEWMVLSAMMGLIFISGMFLESLPNVVIWAPILAPIAADLGLDPLHFAVIFMVGIAIGFITPPYGLNLFVVSSVTDVPFMMVARQALIYSAALVAVWVLVVAVPQLSTWLPAQF